MFCVYCFHLQRACSPACQQKLKEDQRARAVASFMAAFRIKTEAKHKKAAALAKEEEAKV